MTISDVVKRAALKWVQATVDPDATEVTDFSQYSERRGNCDTCGWDQILVRVDYRTTKSSWRTGSTEYEGGFAEFINTLDQYDI